MPNATSSAWTDELVSTLKHLFADGCSQSQIANAIGHQHGVHFSRSAIGGKLVRLGLARPQSEPRPKSQAPRVRKPRPARIAGLPRYSIAARLIDRLRPHFDVPPQPRLI